MLKNKVFVGALVFALAVFSFGLINNAQAATCTATAGGDWNTAGTWTDCGHIPTTGDVAIIPSGQAVTISSTPATTPASLTINNAGAATSLTMTGSGATLTVTGAVTLSAPSVAGTTTLAVGADTLNAGSISIAGGTAEIAALTASTGTITTTGGITFSGSTVSNAQLTTTGMATINDTGTISGAGTLSLTTGTLLKFTGTSAVNTAYTTWKDWQVVSGTTTLGAAQTVTGLKVNNGATLAGSTFLLTDTGTSTGVDGFYIDVGGTYSGSGGVTLSGIGCTIDGDGTLSNTGTLTLTGAKTVASTSSMTYAGTIALSASTIITNNGTVTTTAAGGITGTDGTSNWTNGVGSSLYFSGATNSLLATGVLTASANPNIVNYNLGGAQTVKVPASSYYNLYLSGSGVKTIPSTLTISNNLFLLSSSLSPVVLANGSATTVAGGLQIYGAWKAPVSWGSSGSAATTKNDVYFAAANTGTVTPTISHSGGANSITCSSGAIVVNGTCVLSSSNTGGSSTTTSGGGTTTATTTTTTTSTTPAVAAVFCPAGAMFDTATGAKCTATITVNNPVTCPNGAMFDTASGQKCTAWTTTAPFNETVASAMGTGVIKLGSTGAECKVWQMFLNGHGAKLTADGNCGKLTIAAAKTWQASVGLTADGMLGAMSRAKANLQ